MSEPIALPQAGWFGDGLFGWFHAPARDAPPRRCAIVLCNPFGYEAMCTHRTYRKLAARLSQDGFPALRFDWPGSGDSAGDQIAGHLPAWPAALQAAVDHARARAGSDAVLLFGLRLGGTLALAAGGRIHGVKGVAAWAPHKSGKKLMRELRAFRLLKDQPPPGVEGAEEAAGYLLSSDDLRALSMLDAGREEPLPARVLLLFRDDLAPDDALEAALADRGAEVAAGPLRGYAELMRSIDSVVPEDAIDATAAWFGSVDAQLRAVAMPAAPAAELRPPHAERPCRFGPSSRLFGVLTPAARDQGRPTVLILNTGSDHHVGPNRLGVRMARALAAQGFPCFRFDVSGIGDSAPAEDGGENKIYSLVAQDDVREALVFLRADTGAKRFALFGICSGAYLAFHAADDPAVLAQVLVNLQRFKWSEGDSLAYAVRRSGRATRFYLRQLFETAAWKRLLQVKIDLRYAAALLGERLLRRLRQHASALASLIREGTYEHSDVARRFARFDERGGTALLVYSRDDGGIDVMEEHLGRQARKMRGRAGFVLSVVDGADHTFTSVRSQDALLELVRSHLSRAFPWAER